MVESSWLVVKAIKESGVKSPEGPYFVFPGNA